MSLLADEFVGRESFEGLQSSAVVVGSDEVVQVPSKLVVIVVVKPFDGGILGDAFHPLDLAIGPGMLWSGGAVVDIGFGIGIFEEMGPEEFAFCYCLFDQRNG